MRASNREISIFRVFSLLMMVSIAGGCSNSRADVAHSSETLLPKAAKVARGPTKLLTCKEYVVQKAASDCVELEKTMYRDGPSRVEIPKPDSRCALSGITASVAGQATNYVDEQKLTMATVKGAKLDWNAVVVSCLAGARLEIENFCETDRSACEDMGSNTLQNSHVF